MDEHDRLLAAGWSEAKAKALANKVFDLQFNDAVSSGQIDAYSKAFGITASQESVERMTRTICKARAAACREGTARLPVGDEPTAGWIHDALADEAPFAFEQDQLSTVTATAPEAMHVEGVPRDELVEDKPPSPPLVVRAKKLLTDAGEECVAAYLKQGAWDTDSVKQVRTALRMFDYACGGNVFIEDLKQRHVSAFTDLCEKLPNRLGTDARRADGRYPSQLGASC